jgi:hypothetical protein
VNLGPIVREMPEKRPKQLDLWKWIVVGVVIIAGLSYAGDGIRVSNMTQIGLGVVIAIAPFLGVPQLRHRVEVVFKIVYKPKRQEQTQEVTKSAVKGHVIQSGRDTIINPPPPQLTPPALQQTRDGESEEDNEDTVEVYFDEAPMLQPKGETHYTITWSKDTYVQIEVNGDDRVSVELLTPIEFEKKRQNKGYATERYRYRVYNANIEYEVRRTGDWIVWVRNESRQKQQVGVRITGA